MTAIFAYILYLNCMTVYEIICPITNGSVWVGITKNIEVRYTQHLWGTSRDSKEKAEWCANLKSKNLAPILNILIKDVPDSIAKKQEKLFIINRIKAGHKLFNVIDNKLIYQYDKSGNLLDIFFNLDEAKSITGVMPKMSGLTSGGFVWTNGGFNPDKLKKLKESKQVLCKKVAQISKDGNVVNIFDGVREANRVTGIDHRSISQVASGSKIRKTAGGFKWKYV